MSETPGGSSQQPPTQPPPTGGGFAPGAASSVAAPAICLMVTAGIGIALDCLSLLIHILGLGLAGMQWPGLEDQPRAVAMMMHGPIGITFGCIGILIGILILYAGVRMRALENHGLAVAASILAMIPCISPCCILGLPFGIWALVVLLDANVKAAFRS